MPATRCARGPSLGAATLAACGKTHAAFERRFIPAEPRRVVALCVAFRSKYTRASSPGGGSSLTRLVGRAPRRPRRSHGFHHRLLAEGTEQKRRFWAPQRGFGDSRNREELPQEMVRQPRWCNAVPGNGAAGQGTPTSGRHRGPEGRESAYRCSSRWRRWTGTPSSHPALRTTICRRTRSFHIPTGSLAHPPTMNAGNKVRTCL